MIAILRAGLGLVDGFLRLVPGGARRPPGHVPRRGGAAARRVLREHPVGRRGRRGVRRGPDARHRRKRRPGHRPHEARGRAAHPFRVPGRGARGRRAPCGKRTRTCRSSPPRSIASWTRRATSGPGSAMRATASSVPIADPRAAGDEPPGEFSQRRERPTRVVAVYPGRRYAPTSTSPARCGPRARLRGVR